MSSVAFVIGKALYVDSINYAACPKTVSIPCEGTRVENLAWAVPIVANGLLIGYDFTLVATKPSSDSVRVLRIYNNITKSTWWIVVADDATQDTFDSRCNACCGATPTMPTVTIPDPLICTDVCADDSGDYIFDFPIPANPNTLEYIVSGGTFNNAAATALSPDTFANVAALLAGVQADWSAYGTWSLEATNTILRLTSTTTTCAGMNINLVPAEYCMLIPEDPTDVNGITIGGSDIVFPQISFDNTTAANRNAIVDAISPYLIGELSIAEDGGNPGDWYLHYTGLQKPEILQLDGVDVTDTDFSTGNCP